MSHVLILRPQPAAGETAERAEALGLQPIMSPLFTISPCRWDPPDPSDFDAVMFTSANAPRLAGPALERFVSLPCYAVGPATEAQARLAGFSDIRIGPSDAEALLARATADGIRRLLHLCGREHMALDQAMLPVTRVIVYASDACDTLPAEAEAALAAGALALLHSPRAAGLFAALVGSSALDRGAIRLAAISGGAADAAGPGWRQCAIAPAPRDEALLELAAKLCKTEG